MEAVEKTLTYQEDTGLYSKLLPDKKDNKCNRETKGDESNYVDLDDLLDMKSDAKTVKVTFTGEANQLAVIKCDSGTVSPNVCDNEDKITSEDRLIAEEDSVGGHSKWPDRSAPGALPSDTLLLIDADFENGNDKLLQTEFDPGDCINEHVRGESDEDMYLNSKTESDKSEEEDSSGDSVVLSDQCEESDPVEDESHYITTHEIQLTELDHDVDYDLGRGTWDFEDDNLVYSFVDYASFESDDTTREGTLILEGASQTKVKSGNINKAPSISTEQESDLCDSDKCASSDESMCRRNQCGNSGGQIHLSIKTSSKARNESANNIHVADRSHFFFASTDACRAEGLCDRAQYFIPAPGRQHLATTKLRGKDLHEYSSGASSSISELDDADKEVRNLTAKSFRSLACPYFDAINLSTSSESSVSEYGLGLNQWSAYMDLKYGNMSQGREKNVIAHKSSRATFEMSKNADGRSRHGRSSSSKRASQTRMYALNKKMTSSQQASASTKKIELKDPFQAKEGEVITLTETLNFCCNFEAGLPEGARRPKCSRNAQGSRSRDEAPGARSGCEAHHQHCHAGEGVHKKAIFASSLLKNVISKKMQLEHERKMERGEIRDSHPPHSPCLQCKEQEAARERRRAHRRVSDTSSGFTAGSLDEQCVVAGSRPNSCGPSEEQRGGDALDTPPSKEKGPDEKADVGEPLKVQLNHSQNSAFKSWKDGEQEPQKEVEVIKADSPSTREDTAEGDAEAKSRLTKFSQLFVPSSQLLSKEEGLLEAQLSSAPAGASTCQQIGEREATAGLIETDHSEAKKPEIKIRLRSVKETKGYSLNIASLLTPKIRFNTINTLKAAAGDSKCLVSDKIPHFTVRDIRENKYKFQPPIYHVRDVRKLVKSSYRFVALDNNDNKCPVAPSVTVDVHEDKANRAQGKILLPAPIVIKCHSVKTNCNVKQPGVIVAEVPVSQKQAEADRSSPPVSCEASRSEATSSHWLTGRAAPAVAKPFHPDRAELQLNIESRLTKQRQDKLTGDSGERKSEPKIPKQAALEKLKAAVKTMEQLYVFDRNEWKRKTQAPRPITDSHVLSLIASEEQGAEEIGAVVGSVRLNDSESNTERFSQALLNTSRSEISKAQQDKGSVRIIRVPYNEDTFKTHSQQSKTFSNKSVLHFGNSNKTPVSISSLSDDIPQSGSLSQTLSVKSSVSKTPMAPLSLKITPTKCGQVDQAKVKSSPASTPATVGNSDYLTIPGGGCASEIKLPNRDLAPPNILSSEGNSNVSLTNTGDTKRPERSEQPIIRSPFIMETPLPEHPPATIYHHPIPAAVQGPQPQVFCFSPSIPTLSPPPLTGEPFTQRKMLLDPTTGHYYLVDTPVQATTKRLFDPETGQYVDVPMPHSPGNPVVAPVPVSVSPLALSPGGAYAPTYVIYPGFIPSPTLAGQVAVAAAPPQAMCQPCGPGEQGKHGQRLVQDMTSAETPYYSATGGDAAVQMPQRLPVTVGHVNTRGGGATSERKPVISITAPQGPRIIAPPSFDGTTMSFVVEHR